MSPGWGIFSVLILILLVLVYGSFRSPKDKPSRPLEEIASIMKEAKEEKDRKEHEKEMVEYAKSKMKDEPPPNISRNVYDFDRPVRANTRDLIPYNLSEEQKQILEQFYNSK